MSEDTNNEQVQKDIEKVGRLFGWAYMEGFEAARQQFLDHLIPDISPDWETFSKKLSEKTKEIEG